MADNVTKCLFCNSISWGKECRWSPFKVHVHNTFGKKCCFCGSFVTVGPSCRWSPTGKHMPFPNMISTFVPESLSYNYLIQRFLKDYKDFPAFKQGIIDKNGNTLVSTLTEKENRFYGILDRFIVKIRSLLGEKFDLLKDSVILESYSKNGKPAFSPDLYKKELEFKYEAEVIIKRLKETIKEKTEQGLPQDTIDKVLLEIFNIN